MSRIVRMSPTTPTRASNDPAQARVRSSGRKILTLPHACIEAEQDHHGEASQDLCTPVVEVSSRRTETCWGKPERLRIHPDRAAQRPDDLHDPVAESPAATEVGHPPGTLLATRPHPESQWVGPSAASASLGATLRAMGTPMGSRSVPPAFLRTGRLNRVGRPLLGVLGGITVEVKSTRSGRCR